VSLSASLNPRRRAADIPNMQRRTWLFVVAGVGGLACLCVALWTTLSDVFPAGDYPGPPCIGCDSAGPPIESLVHGHVSGFFSTQPIMGSVSLWLRAPFVGLATLARGDLTAQYRVGTLVVLLAAMFLLLPAVALMLRRGQHPLIVLTVLAAILVGPTTFKAVFWGHPEELLGAALAVAAVLAAIHGRGVAAGVLLGLAVGTKQWGLFAVLPVLTVARGQRRQVVAASVVVVSAFVLPMLAADPARFVHQNLQTASAAIGVAPTNVWWAFHRLGIDPSTHEQINRIPNWMAELSHPLAVAVVLGLSGLYWRRSADRHPYDVLQLLAALFLLRCLLDPLAISYHHAPFVLTVAIFEGLRRRGMPVVTLTATAVILILGQYLAPLNKPDLMNAVYLMWGVPTVIYLIVSSFGRRVTLGVSMPQLDQPAVVSRAVG
jgi:glycosyl transferase family 87